MRFRFDLLTLLCIQWFEPVLLLYCDKTFTYYEEYGKNSFNVSCSGITKGYEHILENITINNEISLTIADSTLEHVTPDIFKNVRNIKILHLLNSTFEFGREQAIFSKLEQLETLIIKDTRFEIGNNTLNGLSNLKHLELSNNSISAIDIEGLKNLKNLKKLELIDNLVDKVEHLQLCELKKLKLLNLRRNLITDVKSFNFFCVEHEQSLDLAINSEPILPSVSNEISYYNVTNVPYDLAEIDLSYNQIVDLGYSLDNLGNLRILNVGYNKLVSVKYLNFKSLVRLQRLVLRSNQLRTFDNRVFLNKTLLSFVDLANNLLATISITNVPQLYYLDLSHNNLSVISLNNLRSLEKLDLGYNALRKLEDAFSDIPNLITLNLGNNNLELQEGLFRSIKSVKYLSLSNNSLHEIPEKVFAGLTNLKLLDLSFNDLRILKVKTFHDMENLEVLNLSSNSITSLSYLMVEPLKNLRSLDIAANKLIFIEYDVILSKLPGLSNINIKSNQLTCENLGKIIVFLKRKHIVYTNSEDHDFKNLNQNVAGIPCKSANVISNSLLGADKNKSKVGTVLYNFGMFSLVVLVAILTGIVGYRFYIYLKRRKYRADEFELVVD